jgi:hypothetical protein
MRLLAKNVDAAILIVCKVYLPIAVEIDDRALRDPN